MLNLLPKKNIDDIWPMYNKKVLIRVDFNVPIKNGIISNDYRIRSTIPTLKRVLDQGGKAIIISHMGRPKGLKYAEAEADDRVKRRALRTWAQEAGTGKTTYFALLSGAEKKRLLSWSSLREEAMGMSEADCCGKTTLFSRLHENEKKVLLDRLTGELKQEVLFPNLRQYQGYDEELSLQPVAKRLEELLNNAEESSSSNNDTKVLFAEDCMDAQRHVDELQPGQALVLENVRFYSDEGSKKESERMIMAKKIASYGDYFVSDAFGTAHRNAATMTGIPKVMGHGAAGYLMSGEINSFVNILKNPKRPMVAIVGGAKVSDKILLLEHMLSHIDVLIIGGAMAYTFLNTQGYNIGNSFHQAGQSFTDRYGEKRNIDKLATTLLEHAKSKNITVGLPCDHVCHTKCEFTEEPLVTMDANVPDGYMALDIGPKTVEYYRSLIQNCKTAVWNGPMGVFEIDCYSNGTFSIAKALGDATEDTGMLSIIGGGDSASAAEQSGEAVRMSHVSTGGGASLELLEGHMLPGIGVLDDKTV